MALQIGQDHMTTSTSYHMVQEWRHEANAIEFDKSEMRRSLPGLMVLETWFPAKNKIKIFLFECDQ